jgi:hypothetical protein
MACSGTALPLQHFHTVHEKYNKNTIIYPLKWHMNIGTLQENHCSKLYYDLFKYLLSTVNLCITKSWDKMFSLDELPWKRLPLTNTTNRLRGDVVANFNQSERSQLHSVSFSQWVTPICERLELSCLCLHCFLCFGCGNNYIAKSVLLNNNLYFKETQEWS